MYVEREFEKKKKNINVLESKEAADMIYIDTYKKV